MSITATDLHFRYHRGSWILRTVDLRIHSGEAVAVTGPSGSGKTTLIQLFGGLLKPTIGAVSGETSTSRRLGSLDVTWIFQSSNAFGRRTVLDNIVSGLFTSGIIGERARSMAREMAARLGLDDKERQLANSLSGGELQRVGIARALIGRRSLILADEPTGQLDYDTTMLVADAMLTVRAQDSILVVATHDEEIAARCDRRIAIRNGQTFEIA